MECRSKSDQALAWFRSWWQKCERAYIHDLQVMQMHGLVQIFIHLCQRVGGVALPCTPTVTCAYTGHWHRSIDEVYASNHNHVKGQAHAAVPGHLALS